MPATDPKLPDNVRSLPESVEPAQESAPDPNATDVYAIHGADPEVLAYAMAKYSRSSLTMRESLAQISAQRAEQFLNTFYFQYGHRSIADLAHIPFAIERLSLLAAIDLVDEQRWDGQERSTRYQDFRRSGWFTPDFGPNTSVYTASIEALFAAYERTGARMFDALRDSLPRPEVMKPEAYERTLKARAFDVARYLLPLATNTSLGQIVNARTLETQVSRLLSSAFPEIRSLGLRLRAAAVEPAWNVGATAARDLVQRSREMSDPVLAADLEAWLLREVKTAPTLVKYASRSTYLIDTAAHLSAAAADLLGGVSMDAAPLVDLLDDDEPLEVELATSLLYPHCHYPYRQIRSHVAALTENGREELIALGSRYRGPHDELLRSFSAGSVFRFDILMDIGGFRDMHRHRRCVQLLQGYTDQHGYDDPVCPGQPTIAEAGFEQDFRSTMASTYEAFRALQSKGQEPKVCSQYLLPLATRRRAMFKMDFAEALYISELRSGAAGHFSYRRVAWEMYLAIARRHPALHKLFRVEDVYEPIDLLRR